LRRPDSTVSTGRTLDRNNFKPLAVRGFDNALAGSLKSDSGCDASIVARSIGVGKAITLSTDLKEVALELDAHPLVKYPLSSIQNANQTVRLGNIIKQSWDEFAMSRSSKLIGSTSVLHALSFTQASVLTKDLSASSVVAYLTKVGNIWMYMSYRGLARRASLFRPYLMLVHNGDQMAVA
jgi:hypothetical protein